MLSVTCPWICWTIIEMFLCLKKKSVLGWGLGCPKLILISECVWKSFLAGLFVEIILLIFWNLSNLIRPGMTETENTSSNEMYHMRPYLLCKLKFLNRYWYYTKTFIFWPEATDGWWWRNACLVWLEVEQRFAVVLFLRWPWVCSVWKYHF